MEPACVPGLQSVVIAVVSLCSPESAPTSLAAPRPTAPCARPGRPGPAQAPASDWPHGWPTQASPQ